MQINEIFSSIDGEGSRTGYLTTFIRSQFCNLSCIYCFGIKKSRHIPRVSLVQSLKDNRYTSASQKLIKGVNVDLDQVKIGDEIFTLDTELNVVPTKVTNVLKREVTEWYEIVIDGTTYFVTPEHPVFTTSGMKAAQDLKVGDVLLHKSYRQLNNLRMRLNNPMFDPEINKKSHQNRDNKAIGEKISQSILNKKLQGTYQTTWSLLSDEQKQRICKNTSERMLRENNPNWIENYKYRNYSDLKQSISRNLGNFYCELCGKSGSDSKLFVHHIDENRDNDRPENLSVVCSHCHNIIHERGYNFWTATRKDGKQSLQAIANCNGCVVESIKHIDIAQHKHYGKSYGPKPLTVYNLSCAPYNTYLLDGIWVHNCDTKYSWDECDENGCKQYKDMTISEIVEECVKLGNRRITFTGGEPLIQKDAAELVIALMHEGFEVNIETNGAVDIIEFRNKLVELWDIESSLDFFFTLDYKCPSSGMEEKMILSNIEALKEGDVLKFVVGNKEDLDSMLKIINMFNIRAEIFVSPVYGDITGAEIVEYMKEHDLQNVRVQVQLHKYFWPPEMRGV